MERVEREAGSSDTILAVTLVLLVGTGIAFLFSTVQSPAGTPPPGSPFRDFLLEQRGPLALGLVGLLAAARIPLELIRRSVPLLLLGSLLLMLLTLVPGVTRSVNGARRWLFPFGMSVQPSEIAKMAVVLYLSSIFDKKRDRMDDVVNTLLPALLVVLVFVAVTYLQNDYSTAGIILLLGLALFFVAGASILHLAMFVTVAVPLAVLLLFSQEHRVRRIVTFLNPLADPAGAGYQVLASQRALTEGGIWGLGLGQGVGKLGGLPEARSDFVFAVVGEETGFLGAILVLALFGVFAWRGFAISLQSRRSTDTFRSNLAFGVTFAIVVQALVNMSMATGLLPTTGIPLPFFSNGGSSLVVSLTMCGLLFNTDRGVSDRAGLGAGDGLGRARA
jgi:cell division protein FtsW